MAGQHDSETSLKTELLHRLRGITLEEALFPNNDRILVELIKQLEQSSPIPYPLEADNLPKLWGDWQLIYASRGTIVTRNLPPLTQGWSIGIKIKRIWQRLESDHDRSLQVNNGAELELPILGTWKIKAEGKWYWEAGEQQTAKVRFSAFALQTLHPFGLSQWQLPELRIPVMAALSQEALWITSYLDADLRIGRGATGNLFVFSRCLQREHE